MKRIVDKIILLICIVLFVMWKAYNYQTAAALFLYVGLSCVYEYSREQRILKWSCVLSIAAAFFWSPTALFVPLLAYDLFSEKEWIWLGAGAVLSARGYAQYGIEGGIVFALLFIVSGIFSIMTGKYQQLEQEHKRQRDDGRELELVLKNKNKALIDRQDYEVHLATLRERNRIAREIHDNVGHLLSRSILQTGALKAVNTQQELIEPLHSLTDTLDQAMTSIRESVHNLHEESLDLRISIENILKEYPMYTINFVYEIDADLSKDLKYCFLAVIKEAFSNVVKHSNASEIQIRLKEFSELHQLLFRDNGAGYQEERNKGIGLENMKDRVYALGGNLYLQHENGFQIFISVPKTERKEK